MGNKVFFAISPTKRTAADVQIRLAAFVWRCQGSTGQRRALGARVEGTLLGDKADRRTDKHTLTHLNV